VRALRLGLGALDGRFERGERKTEPTANNSGIFGTNHQPGVCSPALLLLPLVRHHSFVHDFVPRPGVAKQSVDVDPAIGFLFSDHDVPEPSLVFLFPERRGVKRRQDQFFQFQGFFQEPPEILSARTEDRQAVRPGQPEAQVVSCQVHPRCDVAGVRPLDGDAFVVVPDEFPELLCVFLVSATIVAVALQAFFSRVAPEIFVVCLEAF